MTTYPNGEPIPEALPQAYQEGNLEKNCSNCAHVMFLNKEYFCGLFSGNPEVRADWVCAAWKSTAE
jgi:hypothetical protein